MAYGVSNSFKRGLLRTYARRNRHLDDDGPPRKIIRMDDQGFVQISAKRTPSCSRGEKDESVNREGEKHPIEHQEQLGESHSNPSTPVRELIFSDPAMRLSSPLSSSPPPETSTSPPATLQKSSFGLLKRKRSNSMADSMSETRASTPLTEITANEVHSRQPSSRHPFKKPKLTQMVLDLGQDSRKTCKECGMSYTPTAAEDSALHKSFHSLNTAGVDVGKTFIKDARQVAQGSSDSEVVVAVDRKSASSLRKRVEKALEVVTQDLGAVCIEEDKLWSSIPCPVSGRKFGKALAKAREKGLEEEPREDCYKAFMYIDRDKCIGLCLAERVNVALRVVEAGEKYESGAWDPKPSENPRASRGSCIMTERTTDTVLLGISRIWTSRAHRRKGIATALLDCARRNFFFGVEVPKEMVAFSQPTESGKVLARRWHGQLAGWHVYEMT